MLTWNNNSNRYEANVNGHQIEVDGDTYAETIRDLTKEYVKEGMDEDAARDKADNELSHASGWMHSPNTGVWIDGVSQE